MISTCGRATKEPSDGGLGGAEVTVEELRFAADHEAKSGGGGERAG